MLLRKLDQVLGLRRRRRERLLDEHVFAGAERGVDQGEMGRNGSGDCDRLDRPVGEDVLHVGRCADRRIAPLHRLERLLAQVADRDDLGRRQLVEVPHQIGSPIAEPDHRDSNRRILERRAEAPGSLGERRTAARTHAVPLPLITASGVRQRRRKSRASDQPRA